jgi:hypothetical protein
MIVDRAMGIGAAPVYVGALIHWDVCRATEWGPDVSDFENIWRRSPPVAREGLAAGAYTRSSTLSYGRFIMLRLSTVAIGLTLTLSLLASNAGAQWGYPRGYGGYGMSKWGQDPGAGYMAGLGSFARGQGAYEADKAKADAINVETMVKWNKALRARQAALREDQRNADAKENAERAVRVDRMELRDGTTLNNLLSQIFDIDPAAVKSGKANAPISSAAIKEIPFEWDSEAITFCMNEMTGKDDVPTRLMAPTYAEERIALNGAIEHALKEDARGTVSMGSRKRINEAITKFRAKFMKNSADFEPGYDEALSYFTTMASLSRLVNDRSMKEILTKLEDDRERNVGDLIGFMSSLNLRFGPATTDRQVEIYARLVPILTAIRDQVKTEEYVPSALDRSGDGFKKAAKQVFKPMPWDALDAHNREQ